MSTKIITIVSLLIFSANAIGQTASDINTTDQQGRKQGHWIKKYPNKNIMYEGNFKDDHPVGEFRRYYEDKTIKSIFIFSSDGKIADATIYHPNGFVSAQGKYINQLKEGKWKFFSYSVNGYLICEEDYSKNIRHGQSLKFFPDSTVAERINFVNDIRQGEWLQYYSTGKTFQKSYYKDGLLNGKIEIWFENGAIELSGFYKNNLREGHWHIYNEDGNLKYEMDYVAGITKDRQMDLDASHLIDSLEKNSGKIVDPEKTGEMR
jgi:antitoxin component YwqK of YwqJK toxin-antitoxin module